MIISKTPNFVMNEAMAHFTSGNARALYVENETHSIRLYLPLLFSQMMLNYVSDKIYCVITK